jgi:hypothetical protein
MAALSGKEGKVYSDDVELLEVRNWKFTRSANVKAYQSTDTPGYQKTARGMFAGTIAFEVTLDTGTPLESVLVEGDEVELKLVYSGDEYWTVPCVISDVAEEVNILDGEPATVSVEAESVGEWEYGYGSTSLRTETGGVFECEDGTPLEYEE